MKFTMFGNARPWRAALLAAATVGALGAMSAALAQDNQPIRIVFPFAPGGAGDMTARLLADRFQTTLGRPALVENRTGAAGKIGVVAVKNALPDGNTLLFTAFAAVTIYPYVYKNLEYDPFTQLAPVSQVVTFDYAIGVRSDHPAKTPQELLAWLKANPQKAQYGSPGAGALPHFFGLLVGKAAGVDIQHVAYKGSGLAINDLLGGQIAMVSTTTSDFAELHKAGKIRVIATSGKTRSAQTPDVPTFVESGINIEGTGWYGLLAPAGTPQATLDRYAKIVADGVRQPDFAARLAAVGLTPTGTTPQELAAIQKKDAALWEPVIKASGFEAE